jgi:methyl-accepting chemotaxis protein
VVASEVRTLAQRSAAAAKDIKMLIGDSVQKVASGSMLVNQAGVTMNDIVAGVARVTDIMSEITAASSEQSAGIEQVNTAVVQMDQVTQQNAALVEEAAAAAAALREQADALAQLVGVFRLHGAPQLSLAGHTAAKSMAHAAAPLHAGASPQPRLASVSTGLPAGRQPAFVGEWSQF